MTITLLVAIFVLIVISAFFSGAETSMMALNRYRLRHLAKTKHRPATRAYKLLSRPDRLLGVILVGNTFANILASALATMLAMHLFGDIGVVIATIVLTVIILIFAEIMPKTVAAYTPERIAFPASYPLKLLLRIFYPLIWILNTITNSILKCCGMKFGKLKIDDLSQEELRSIVFESQTKLNQHQRNMLLGILDLERATVEDCMIPRKDLYAINYEDTWNMILEQLAHSPYSRAIVYQGDMEHILGELHLKDALKLLQTESDQAYEQLKTLLDPPYFVKNTTNLLQQLRDFQTHNEKFGIVINEAGKVLGIVTVEDIVEEVMGEFTELDELR